MFAANEKLELGDCNKGGGLALLVLGKLIPPNVSVRPPNASCFCAGAEAVALKDDWRSCEGCGAGCGAGCGL